MKKSAALLPHLAAALITLLLSGCGDRGSREGVAAGSPSPGDSPAAGSATAAAEGLDLTDMEPQVKARLLETRSAALESPLSAAAWGRYAMVAHAHELWDQAAAAYSQARKLDPDDPQWPYYLGDVLSVQGTDLEAAVEAFRRAMTLEPDYGPAHMRLGNVLIALDRGSEAAVELERALQLTPDLQPARVALAQVRLAEGRLEASEKLLDEVLASEPRHGQALATIGRVYMRQGRRDEARAMSQRAREAASYNLYSDPLMGKVVAEGVSKVQIWERAKGFLESGNYEQASIGLRRVVQLDPSNADAHLQLAVTYGNLGDFDRSRYHLERTVALDPEQVEPRLDLAQLLLDQNRPAEALGHLRAAEAVEPERAGLGWLLGRALAATGAASEALEAFEDASRTDATPAPWARKAWGRSLAEAGDASGALQQFRVVVSENPADAEAHFYAGLVLEGLGRSNEAASSYCRSLALAPDSPAAARLGALGASCSRNR